MRPSVACCPSPVAHRELPELAACLANVSSTDRGFVPSYSVLMCTRRWGVVIGVFWAGFNLQPDGYSSESILAKSTRQ